MKVATRTVLGGLALALCAATPAAAQPPSADALAQKMRALVWPEKPSLRKLTVRISGTFGEASQWICGQARKKMPEGGRMVTTVLAPADSKGIAWLVQEGAGGSVQWAYEPMIRRVRKLFPLPGYEAFLGSDFTYADLGLVDEQPTYSFLGEEQHDGVAAYKIQAVPKSQWYYARIVTWIAKDSGFPLERQFYDPANQLWKIQRFVQVTAVDGIPTVLEMSMEDKQAGTRTDIDVSEVRYGVDIPDTLFDPMALPKTATASVWK